MCKVWLRDTGKCIRTFKHRQPITAVAMGEDPLPEIVVSGCEAGKVKVWDLHTGNLIKVLKRLLFSNYYFKSFNIDHSIIV
jgi:F-box/WD-40 domain protein 10